MKIRRFIKMSSLIVVGSFQTRYSYNAIDHSSQVAHGLSLRWNTWVLMSYISRISRTIQVYFAIKKKITGFAGNSGISFCSMIMLSRWSKNVLPQTRLMGISDQPNGSVRHFFFSSPKYWTLYDLIIVEYVLFDSVFRQVPYQMALWVCVCALMISSVAMVSIHTIEFAN